MAITIKAQADIRRKLKVPNYVKEFCNVSSVKHIDGFELLVDLILPICPLIGKQ